MVKTKALIFVVPIFLCVLISAGVEAAEFPKLMDKCALCQKTSSADGGKLKECAKCGRVKYCSRVCQVSHWKQKRDGHKSQCQKRIDAFFIPISSSITLYSKREDQIVDRLIRSGSLLADAGKLHKAIQVKLELKNSKPSLEGEINDEVVRAFDETAALIRLLIFEYEQQIKFMTNPDVAEKEKLEVIGIFADGIKKAEAQDPMLSGLLGLVSQMTKSINLPPKARAAFSDPAMLQRLARRLEDESKLEIINSIESLVETIKSNIKDLEYERDLFNRAKPSLKGAYVLAEYFYNGLSQYGQVIRKGKLNKMKSAYLVKNKYQYNMSVFRKLRGAANQYLKSQHTGKIIPEPFMSGYWFESERDVEQSPPAEHAVTKILEPESLVEYSIQDEVPSEEENPRNDLEEAKQQEEPPRHPPAPIVQAPVKQEPHRWATPEDISRVVANLSKKNRRVYDSIMAEKIPKTGVKFTNNDVTKLFIDLDGLMQEQSVENNFLDKSINHQHNVHTKKHNKGYLPRSWVLHLRLSLIKFGMYLNDFTAKTVKEIKECNTLEMYREREQQMNNFKSQLGYILES